MTSPFLARLEQAARTASAPGRAGGGVLDGVGGASMQEILLQAERIARALGPGGAGRRVALLAPPGAAWVSAFVGILLGGGVAVPLSPLYPDAELVSFLETAAADRLVAGGDLEGRAREVAAAAGGLDVTALATLAGGGAGGGGDPRSPIDPGADAVMLFTSGTTGRPKGARITHANLGVQVDLLASAWEIGPGDRLLHALPLHHTHGLVVALLTSLAAGATVHMLPRFDAIDVWESFAEGSVSVFMGVPTMYQRLVEAFDAERAGRRDRWALWARRLRLATSGSAALPVQLAERWRELSGAIPLERYGMTEIGMALSNPIDPAGRRAGWVGTPLPTVEARRVDEEGRDAGDGPGEVWIRGPSVFAGYFRQPTETRDAFGPDGWFKTGDVAEVDSAGAFRLLGRTSVDILKSGGYKLSALEIERVLCDHPAIAEAAVIGVPDETWGDRVVAVVCARPGLAARCSTDEIRGWAKDRVAPYKVPREVHVVDALPRNAMGKVQKRALRDRFG